MCGLATGDGGAGEGGWGRGLSVAERLYYAAQEMLEFAAEVTDIRLESQGAGGHRWQVALDRTAFYPESGGQPCDMGTLEAVAPRGARLEVPVLGVMEEDGEVWHVVEKPLGAGTAVRGMVQAERRHDHMQQHTGQHLLSAMFLKELGAATVSFHLGRESSTIDLAVEQVERAALVVVEEAVNRLIGEDRPVRVATVARSVAETMLAEGALRKVPERDGPIRVVEIEGVEWNACGGTHVGSSGRIGGLTVRGVERVKAGMRVEFCCGLRAIRAARRDVETLGMVAQMLSVGGAEMAGKVRAMLEEARQASKERRHLLEELAGFEARALAGEARLVEAVGRNLEYAKLLAGKVAALGKVGLVRVVDGDPVTVVLAAGRSDVDCGAVMKAALAACGGRGGGSAGLAQGAVAAMDLEKLTGELRSRLAGYAVEGGGPVLLH